MWQLIASAVSLPSNSRWITLIKCGEGLTQAFSLEFVVDRKMWRPLRSRLLHLVLFFFLTWKNSKGSAYDCSCCPHLLELPLLPRIINALLCDNGARGRGGKAGPGLLRCLFHDRSKSTDALWLFDLFNWFVFVGINFEPVICWYKIWTYHHKCF